MRKLVLAAAMSVMALTADVEALASDLPKTAADLGLMSGFPPAADQLVTKDNWLAPPYNRWAYQLSLITLSAFPPISSASPRRADVHIALTGLPLVTQRRH